MTGSTDPDIGYGTLFQTGADSSPEVWTTIAQANSLTPPGMSRDSVDVTHEQSPEGYREFIPGLKDGGETTIPCNFTPAGLQAALAEFALSGTAAVKPRRILWVQGSYLEFNAFLTNLDPDSPIDDKGTLELTFKVTGKPVLTLVA